LYEIKPVSSSEYKNINTIQDSRPAKKAQLIARKASLETDIRFFEAKYINPDSRLKPAT
jgi:hypothetical protein